MPNINCNMLVQDYKGRVCVVKDTCEGCMYNHTGMQYNIRDCALYDLYEQVGLIKNWKTVSKDLPTYRDRMENLIKAVKKWE